MDEIDNGNLYRECNVKYDDFSSDLVEKTNEINFSEFPIVIVTVSGNIPERTLTKIAKELTTINKLAFVNEISKAPILISGPIL